MATLEELDALALALPETTKELEEGRPVYRVHGKMFCRHRTRRRDAVDAHGEPLDDVLMFRLPDIETKELLLGEPRGVFFTTPHFDGSPWVLLRVRHLPQIGVGELHDLVADAWLTRAQRRLARAWLAEEER